MKRDITYIQELLDRYMEGENTQEELRELKEYFLHTDDIPHEFLPYKEMFELLEKPTVIPSVKALESLTLPKQEKKKFKLWHWIVAACMTGWLVIFLNPPECEKNNTPQIAEVVPKVVKPQNDVVPEPLPIVKEDTIKDKSRTSKPHLTNRIVKAKTSASQEEAKEKMNDDIDIIVPSDEPKAYTASSEENADEEYQDPNKVDEFIARLASYNKAEKVTLKNTSQDDNDQKADVYVFQDRKGMDLFEKLLMVAFWYKSDTPGYFLNFSQLQFLFMLKDMKEGKNHLWQAERIGKIILIYSAQAPLGSKINTSSYKEYRQRFIQHNDITF